MASIYKGQVADSESDGELPPEDIMKGDLLVNPAEEPHRMSGAYMYLMSAPAWDVNQLNPIPSQAPIELTEETLNNLRRQTSSAPAVLSEAQLGELQTRLPSICISEKGEITNGNGFVDRILVPQMQSGQAFGSIMNIQRPPVPVYAAQPVPNALPVPHSMQTLPPPQAPQAYLVTQSPPSVQPPPPEIVAYQVESQPMVICNAYPATYTTTAPPPPPSPQPPVYYPEMMAPEAVVYPVGMHPQHQPRPPYRSYTEHLPRPRNQYQDPKHNVSVVDQQQQRYTPHNTGSRGKRRDVESHHNGNGHLATHRRTEAQARMQVSVDAPCKGHNQWERISKKKNSITLRCRVCRECWKTKLDYFEKCADFYAGNCPRGSACPHPHIYSKAAERHQMLQKEQETADHGSDTD